MWCWMLECVRRPEKMLAATQAVRAGTVVWAGVAPPETHVPVNPYDIFRREITIRARIPPVHDGLLVRHSGIR